MILRHIFTEILVNVTYFESLCTSNLHSGHPKPGKTSLEFTWDNQIHSFLWNPFVQRLDYKTLKHLQNRRSCITSSFVKPSQRFLQVPTLIKDPESIIKYHDLSLVKTKIVSRPDPTSQKFRTKESSSRPSHPVCRLVHLSDFVPNRLTSDRGRPMSDFDSYQKMEKFTNLF